MSACRPTTGWWCRSPIATAASRPTSGNPFMSAGKRRPAKCSTSNEESQEAMMSNRFTLKRRSLLGGTAALAVGAPYIARAQDNKRIVVGTWGGDYSRLLAKNIETPLLAPKGWDVVKDEANDPPRRAKMLAEKSLRRGTSDIQRLSSANMYEMNEQGVVEEIALCIMWKPRAVQGQNAGINIETVAPKEGVPMYVSGFAMPKNAPNKPGAYAYLDAMMEASAQEGFAVDMGYNPTVTTANLPPDTQKRIGFTDEEKKRLVDLDYGYLSKNDSAFQEWWNKSFKA